MVVFIVVRCCGHLLEPTSGLGSNWFCMTTVPVVSPFSCFFHTSPNPTGTEVHRMNLSWFFSYQWTLALLWPQTRPKILIRSGHSATQFVILYFFALLGTIYQTRTMIWAAMNTFKCAWMFLSTSDYGRALPKLAFISGPRYWRDASTRLSSVRRPWMLIGHSCCIHPKFILHDDWMNHQIFLNQDWRFNIGMYWFVTKNIHVELVELVELESVCCSGLARSLARSHGSWIESHAFGMSRRTRGRVMKSSGEWREVTRMSSCWSAVKASYVLHGFPLCVSTL